MTEVTNLCNYGKKLHMITEINNKNSTQKLLMKREKKCLPFQSNFTYLEI